MTFRMLVAGSVCQLPGIRGFGYLSKLGNGFEVKQAGDRNTDTRRTGISQERTDAGNARRPEGLRLGRAGTESMSAAIKDSIVLTEDHGHTSMVFHSAFHKKKLHEKNHFISFLTYFVCIKFSSSTTFLRATVCASTYFCKASAPKGLGTKPASTIFD
jgi:hypothetical protein